MLDFSQCQKISLQDLVTVTHLNDLTLSRSASSKGDTSASPLKVLRLDGEGLADRVEKNRNTACELVWQLAKQGFPGDNKTFLAELTQVATTINQGIVPSGSHYREWDFEDGSRCKFQDVPFEVERLQDVTLLECAGGQHDPILVAARAEWRLNGGDIHAFYDGCGRISRLWGARILLGFGLGIPLWESRERYYERGENGIDVFAAYMRERVESCMNWLREMSLPRPSATTMNCGE